MQTTATQEVESALRAAMEPEAICECCGSDVPPGGTVTLGHMAYCADCAFQAAAHTLAPLLIDAWTPADIEASRRDYEEARYVMAILFLRIGNRLARRA